MATEWQKLSDKSKRVLSKKSSMIVLFCAETFDCRFLEPVNTQIDFCSAKLNIIESASFLASAVVLASSSSNLLLL